MLLAIVVVFGWARSPHFSVDILHRSSNIILLFVKDDFNLSWRLALIYGSPYLQPRASVWDSILNVLTHHSGPLLCIEDFNQTLSPSDRLGPSNSFIHGAVSFQQFLFDMDLTKIPLEGLSFTWTNNRRGSNCTFERLDRSFCNGEWASLDLSTSVTNLPIHGSDHSPILLFTSKVGVFRRRQFRFEQFWTAYADCRSIVSSSWQEEFPGIPLY